MPGWLRVLIGPIVGALVGAAAKAIGVELTDDQTQAIGDAASTGLGLLAYGVTAKIVAAKANPGNAASPTMAVKFKADRDLMRPTPVPPSDYTV